jgi:hypothetical protein
LKLIRLVHNSGTVVEFKAEKAEFFLSSYIDHTGKEVPNPNELGGYKIDDGPEIVWLRPSSIDSVLVYDCS